MNPTLLISILALLLISGLLIVLGRRGRKINDHPQCTWCGFDLDGVYPAGVTCPECGAGLKRAGAIRQGVRKRMPALVGLGVTLGVVPLLALIVAIYAVMSGGGVYRQMPTGMLMWSAEFGSGASSGPIADELMNRLTNQAEPMQAEEKQRLVKLILDLQGDSAFAWSETWGDLFESLHRSGDAKKEDYARFLRQAVQLSLQSRPKVEINGDLPLGLVQSPVRVGSGTEIDMMLRIREMRIGEKRISPSDFTSSLAMAANLMMSGNAGMPRDGQIPLSLSISGSASQRRGWVRDNANLGWTLRMPKDVSPGPVRIELDVMMNDAKEFRRMSAQIAAEQQPGSKARSTPPDLVLGTTVELVPAESSAVEPISLSETELKSLRAALAPREISATTNIMERSVGLLSLGDREWTSASMTFDLGTIRHPLAYEVLVKIGDRTQPLGDLVTGRQASPWGGWFARSTQRFANGRLAGFDPSKHKTATVILRPRRAQALRTLDMSSYVTDELVYENVPIRHERMDMRQRTPRVTPTTQTQEQNEESQKEETTPRK
jgi:hypothetical protein